MKVRLIQFVEHGLQIVAIALRTRHELAPARLLHQLQAAAHLLAVEIPAVSLGVSSRRWPAQELAHQNVRQGFEYRRWRSLQDVGNAELQAILVPPDRAVGVGELVEFQANGWNRRARLQLPKYACEDLFGCLKENRALQH